MLAAVLHRLRVVYRKVGDTRFISHLDLTNAFNRALRRAEIPVAYTEGFSPRPRSAFGPPLPLFVEGERELADAELAEPFDVADFIARMNGVLPEGIAILEGGYVSMKASSITASIRQAGYRVEPREGDWDVTAERIAELLARPEIVITKESKGQKKTVDIRPAIVALTLEGHAVVAQVEASPQRTLNVFDLMGALVPGFTAAESARFRVVRTGFIVEEAPAANPLLASAGCPPIPSLPKSIPAASCPASCRRCARCATCCPTPRSGRSRRCRWW